MRPQRPREWLCNADFDLTLAHGGGKLPAKILAAARAMSWHFWPALPPEDALRVPADAPPDFLAYLAACGIMPPRFRVLPDSDPRARFTPFGWNGEAHGLNRHYENPVPAPAVEIMKRVNSRAFSARLERELFPGEACPAVFCETARDLKAWSESAPPGRYVAKGNHGQAGIGQMRFKVSASRAEQTALAAALSRLSARQHGVVIEREQSIQVEFGVLFRLGRGGAISPLRVHRLLSREDGGYAGALVLPGDDPAFAPWRAQAETAAVRIARALHHEGYFGPVGLDMYTWRDGDRLRFRPLVDLNARCSMAWPAHGIARRFPGRAVLVSQVSASALDVPEDYSTLSRDPSICQIDTGASRGFIWLTPLLSLPRHSLAFIGTSENDVLTLRDMILHRFAPKGSL